jgi:Spy/CpxP family protein refolding chaperone
MIGVLLLTGTAYAQQEREKQYLEGAGMGYARPAELNHFPGPMHVLELADQLKLTGEQRVATRKLMDAHKAEARGIGAELVAAERELEQLFRGGKMDEAVLARAARTTAALEGEYRLSHLETHRRMRELLSLEQVKRYDELRGYASGRPEQHRH